MNPLEVSIHGLSFFEGHGVGRSESGKVFFVESACPGDIVNIEVIKDSKKFAFAKITEFIKKSEQRTAPQCSVFESCGGCTLQHVNYSLQIAEKQKVLARYNEKNTDFKLEPFVPSKKEFNYRQRIEVHFENGQWGFYKKKSHDLVFPTHCPTASEKINSHLEKTTKPNGHYHVDEKGLQKRSRGASGVFSQINSEINDKLKNYILETLLLNHENLEKIFDLYAGSGNYSVFLAQKLNETSFIAVELSQTLVDLGQRSTSSDLNINWICSDVVRFLKNQSPSNFKKSVLLVNPPRTGLSKDLITELKQISSTQIIYISCNPMTLFRDIDALSPIFKLKRLKGFDMFPQTMHFETVAILHSS